MICIKDREKRRLILRSKMLALAKHLSFKSKIIKDGMRIEWDVPIKMDDGLVLRADVYRPIQAGSYPVILSYGPYAKGLPFQIGYPQQWERLVRQHPDVMEGSTNKYQAWEVV